MLMPNIINKLGQNAHSNIFAGSMRSSRNGNSLFSELFPNTSSFINNIKTFSDNAMTGNLDWSRNYQMFTEGNAFNALEAQKQRDWEQYLSNTSFSRAKSDLLNAGLNPYMLYGQGGASSPVGSTAHSANAVGSNSSGSQFSSLLTSLLGNAISLANANLRSETYKEMSELKNKTARDMLDLRLNAYDLAEKRKYSKVRDRFTYYGKDYKHEIDRFLDDDDL